MYNKNYNVKCYIQTAVLHSTDVFIRYSRNLITKKQHYICMFVSVPIHTFKLFLFFLNPFTTGGEFHGTGAQGDDDVQTHR